MKCINLTILLGYAATEPRLVTLPSKTNVVSLRVVTYDSYLNAKKEQVETPTFHNVVAYAGFADTIHKYVKKKDLFQLFGQTRVREYEREGVKHSITEVVVKDLILLPSSRASDASGSRATSGGAGDSLPSSSGTRPKQSRDESQPSLPPLPEAAPPPTQDDFPEDDLPF